MEMFENIILKILQLNDLPLFLEKEADLHIAFGIDKNFARGMGILMGAIQKHNKDEKIVFHVFTDGLEAADLDKLKEVAKSPNLIIKIYYIDIHAFKFLPTTMAWSYATYYRFIMGKVLYGSVDKVLYIDADILCVGSLKALKEIDLGENIVLAISEAGLFNVNRLGLKQGHYFNAGVLYIDINKWNDAKIAESAVEMLQKNPEKYTYLDQDVLNILLDEKTKFIDSKWNYLYDMRKMNNTIPEGLALIHFIGDKPWQEWSQHHFMVKLYRKYADLSPWADVPLNIPKHYKDKKRMARSYAKRNMYMKAMLWYIKYSVAKMKSKM
jgi:Lipopolysaccharide biosynthesis proteins, LPS:glycosyltransferases